MAYVSTEVTRGDLVALIQWLALPYINQPVWEVEGQPPVPGENPDYRARLKATWEALGLPQGPSGPGVWGQCNLCGSWQVIAPIVERQG